MLARIFVVIFLALPIVCTADDFRVATVIKADVLQEAKQAAPADSVSDQPVSHVESAEGRLEIGVVHRPVIEPGADPR